MRTVTITHDDGTTGEWALSEGPGQGRALRELVEMLDRIGVRSNDSNREG